MKLLILGGTGTTGRHLIELALAAGHEVTALVRDPAKAGLTGAKLTVLQCSVTDTGAVKAAMAGHDAVLSTLGPRIKDDPICGDAAKAVVSAMQSLGVKRVLWISAGGVGDSAPQMRQASFVFGRIIMPLFLTTQYANHARAEEALRASGLEWTIVRPVQLVDGAGTGQARAVPIGGQKVANLKVARRELAKFMFDELIARAHLRQAPIVEG